MEIIHNFGQGTIKEENYTQFIQDYEYSDLINYENLNAEYHKYLFLAFSSSLLS